MAVKSAPLASWPWERIRTYKYYLYTPLAAKALLKAYHGDSMLDDWCFHILFISILRCCIYESWHALSRSTLISKKWSIQNVGVDFQQVDREFDWDNHVILQALVAAAAAQAWIPAVGQLSPWNLKGIALLVLLHMGPTEYAYYHIHRAFHQGYLYERYHSLHHASTRPEPSTAGTGTFLEHLLLTLLMSLPIAGVIIMGEASIGMFYVYFLGFDFLKNMIHCNVEVVPLWPFRLLPFLRYLVITPSYHSLHHTGGKSNYCLFLPIYDYLGGTIDETAFQSHAELCTKGRQEVVPDAVFLTHGVDFVSPLHIGFIFRAFSSVPRTSRWWAQMLWPVVLLGLSLVWIWGKAIVVAQYTFRNITHQTWVIPRLGFQYFLPYAFKNINHLIEKTILEADKMGVKVLTLGALNKNEAMNGGGSLFVDKHKDLKIRVCHGNTLTTAVILRELGEGVTEVFLTGATSKIGRAIALYLCRKRVRVLMLTASEERFDAVVKENSKEFQQYLVRATKYQAGQNCKTWIIGKWAGYSDQQFAPPGTHFHQFALPPIFHFRKDCIYGESAGIRLPENIVKGLSTCEHTMRRNVVHACHGGGLIHALEGWKHHEVGAVDVDRIDVVWDAAMKHGLTQV